MGKDLLPSSVKVQDSILYELVVDWRSPSVSCHVGLSIWQLTSSKPTKESDNRESLQARQLL